MQNDLSRGGSNSLSRYESQPRRRTSGGYSGRALDMSEEVGERERRAVRREARRPSESGSRGERGSRRGKRGSAMDFAGAHRVPLVIAAVLLATVLMLYGPVKRLYVAERTGQVLAVQLESATSKNESLTSDVNRLQTREGIEDEARKHGYVSPGESAIVVDGLPSSQEEDPSAKQTYVDDRDTMTKVLDALFAFDPESV